MNFIQNYFQKRTNIMIANQDYELAEQLMNADYDFVKEDFLPNGEYDGKVVGRKLFHLEGIFLDLTDRTLSHPRVPYAHEDRGGMFANVVKEFGLGNRKIIWQPSDLFDLDSYMDAEWFPEQLLMYHSEYKELQDAKDLYCERSISFLDYFFKRLDIYRACEMPTFIKYYRGVDIDKYKDKIRRITNDFPHLNEKGEYI
ncbi:hypothetical protein [Candidatus Pelagibacter sp.]|uniref:hypothetical protein n=1 Tax=Candidatus Pelagibacter sp. TaxID=2024849 RepID=UPI003F843E85